MSSSHFFKTAQTVVGIASVRLLTHAQPVLSVGPSMRSFRAPLKVFSRRLHSDAVTTSRPNQHEFVAIGGGISALLNIKNFAEQYRKRHHQFPDITIASDESNHWLHQIDPDYYLRPWGQSKEALVKPYQALLSELFPQLAANECPTFHQIKTLRWEFIKRTCKQYGIKFLDHHVQEIVRDDASKEITLMSKSKVIIKFPESSIQLYNFSTAHRDTSNPVLKKVSREGGLLYSEKKSNNPVCMIGGGLSAVWAARDCQGPLMVLRSRNFPMNVTVPFSRKDFFELIEEDSDITIKGDNTLIVEGINIRSGDVIRMRFDISNCFLSLGSVFNDQLTKEMNPAVVTDINPFSSLGIEAGKIAEGSVNPVGGLVHRYAVTAHLLGRYPIEDATNVVRYTNLWRAHVTMMLSQKFMSIEPAYFTLVQPHISKLFRDKDIPTEAELETILRTVYEKVPKQPDDPKWNDIRDILVPITAEYEHQIHPHANVRMTPRLSF
ncbi:MAG: hypothetical protein P4M14_00370 [Gammaproteobacteria bacterium]|nr:hypothetical protein [Gammaproteobacteria bacterium]